MPNTTPQKFPIVLMILDGWGIAPDSESNPVTRTTLSVFERIRSESRTSRLWAHGQYVGLPKDQDGNSEAGHLNLGAGRVVKQDSVVVSEAIKDGTFFKNPAFHEAIGHVKRNHSSMHLMGMLSDGQSAHATPEHLYALLKLMAQEKVERVYVHLFTDGRDSSPRAGRELCASVLRRLGPGQQIATIIGRFYAMDRKKEWGRTERAYNAMVLGEGMCIEDPLGVFDENYKNGVTDEFIEPTVMCKDEKAIGTIQDNDSIIFFNHRSDRARQLTKPFVQKDFAGEHTNIFTPKKILNNLRFVALTDFGPDLGETLAAYPSIDVDLSLPMVLSKKKQIYIAEAEKYAHMTYFFNGGYANPVGGEQRLMAPSPRVDRYDQAPAMATAALADACVSALDDGYDFVAVNIAATDMVAHTGNFIAAQSALVATDAALGAISAAVAKKGGILIITADHGNIEEMKDMSGGQVDTEHSKNQVPCWIWPVQVPRRPALPEVRQEGILADVAPTILELFGIQKPEEMAGKSLFKK
ncbi:phosphoglycerate mutase (2,3-diphosphoglycerate-independent) [bacterium CG10_46_32]|nr:MAG: phosphoglycerate mutase (2,3-diphosphoglycerate-independent) [bacterium CG10_46_32]PIR55678.1 MAG: 2,3-bisphosphoglycerate-independent phosphoglycerate mutase [Parcubacteria group bacterium CG10_big_fil_rev_8_21_14_0_10_46_32]